MLDQDVEIGWQRAGAGATLKKTDGAGVLLATKYQFGFLLALRGLLPHGQGHGEEDAHHGQRDEQRRHRVAARVATNCQFACSRALTS